MSQRMYYTSCRPNPEQLPHACLTTRASVGSTLCHKAMHRPVDGTRVMHGGLVTVSRGALGGPPTT